MSKNFTVVFATLTIVAASIDEALQKAKDEAEIIAISNDDAYDNMAIRMVDIGGAVQLDQVSLEGAEAPEEAELNEFAAAGFQEGKAYYSETEAWTGTIGGRPAPGLIVVSLENEDGRRDTREFRLTENKNLRSVRGNIVLYANKPVDEDNQD